MITLYAKQKKRHRCTEQTFGLCGRRRGCDVLREQHVCYLGWNRSPAQVGCMRQVLGPGALGRSRGIRWRGRWEGGLGWGIHVTPWLIHVNVWQNPLQCCEVISLQLIKINEKKHCYFCSRFAWMGEMRQGVMLPCWHMYIICRHHQLNGHEIEQTPRDNGGQGSLVRCSPWVAKS